MELLAAVDNKTAPEDLPLAPWSWGADKIATELDGSPEARATVAEVVRRFIIDDRSGQGDGCFDTACTPAPSLRWMMEL